MYSHTAVAPDCDSASDSFEKSFCCPSTALSYATSPPSAFTSFVNASWPGRSVGVFSVTIATFLAPSTFTK